MFWLRSKKIIFCYTFLTKGLNVQADLHLCFSVIAQNSFLMVWLILNDSTSNSACDKKFSLCLTDRDQQE